MLQIRTRNRPGTIFCRTKRSQILLSIYLGSLKFTWYQKSVDTDFVTSFCEKNKDLRWLWRNTNRLCCAHPKNRKNNPKRICTHPFRLIFISPNLRVIKFSLLVTMCRFVSFLKEKTLHGLRIADIIIF